MGPVIDDNRWQRLRDLFDAARQYEGDERVRFLAETCADDLLRSEVESLLACGAESDRLFESSALHFTAKLLAKNLVQENNAKQFDPASFNESGSRYQILEKLGDGGMGVVYKAKDTRLNRLVALKFLPPIAADVNTRHIASSAAQYNYLPFERAISEARAASALDHPNICVVHEVDEHEGIPFIVMQCLSGQTLKEKIKGTKLTTDHILYFGIQIANALDAAHKAGIIHRDIKPANIFVTDLGEVKVLDFGIAKLAASALVLREHDPTQHSQNTPLRISSNTLSCPGIAAGTTSYMSPEQVLGQQLDARSDLFSLGIVLYEMSTGVVPFQGETVPAVLDSIVHETPAQPSDMNSNLPNELDRIIAHAMEKSPEQRYQAADEIRDDLTRLRVTITSPSGNKLVLLVVAVMVLCVASVAGYFHFRPRPSILIEQDTVILGDFDNATGDAVFDDTLKQALRVQLEQSPFLNIVSNSRTQQALSYMQRPPTTRLTGEIAREACLRLGGNIIVKGSISTLGSHYVVGLQIVNCQTGEAVGSEQAEAYSRERVLRAMDDAATKLRSRLGESLASIQKYNTPLEQATTRSLDALHAYSLGVLVRNAAGDPHQAIAYFQRAIDLDPSFAMAYAQLGTVYSGLDLPTLTNNALTKAYKLRGLVSLREQLYIESHYYELVTQQADKAIEVYRLWEQTFPNNVTTYDNLGWMYTILGQYESAIDQEQEALRTGMHTNLAYVVLAAAYISLNQPDKAQAILSEAEAQKIGDATFPEIRYELAFLRGDESEMEKQVVTVAGQPLTEAILLAYQADTEAYRGHITKAREFTRRAIESARRNRVEENALSFAEIGALREAEVGNEALTLTQLTSLPLHAHGEQEEILGSLAYARIGNRQKALALVHDLSQHFPLSTLLNEYWIPTIRAAIELHRNNPAQAIVHLERTKRYDLASPQTATNVLLYPVYLRGQAYLAEGLPDKAIAEFQKILDHPGLIVNYPLGSLAHLGIGRGYAMEAEILIMPLANESVPKQRQTEHAVKDRSQRTDALAKARTAYQDFFTIWKDADPDVPLLKQARMEYRKLQ